MPSNPTDRDTLLARIREGGTRRRQQRRRAVIGGATAVVLLLAVSVAALSRSDDRQPVVATASSSIPNTSSTTTTGETTSTAVLDTAPTEASTTTTELVCRNSDNPACGPLVWDPPVNNQPITGSLALANTQPHAGQPVELTISASDPDSTPVVCYADSLTVDQPDSSLPMNCSLTMCATGYTGYGPHDPPPPEGGGDRTKVVQLTFAEQGEYTLHARLVSRSGACGTLYDSAIDVDLSVTVSA